MSFSQRDTLSAIKPIDSKLIPPRGAKEVGFFTPPGGGETKVIYEMDVLDLVAMKQAKEVVRDPKTGEPLLGNALGPAEHRYTRYRHKGPIWRKSRFILVRDGNGNVKKQEGFEPSETEVRERERLERRDAFISDLAEAASQRGMSASELIESVLGTVSDEPDASVAETVPVGVPDGVPEDDDMDPLTY